MCKCVPCRWRLHVKGFTIGRPIARHTSSALRIGKQQQWTNFQKIPHFSIAGRVWSSLGPTRHSKLGKEYVCKVHVGSTGLRASAPLRLSKPQSRHPRCVDEAPKGEYRSLLRDICGNAALALSSVSNQSRPLLPWTDGRGKPSNRGQI